jgi:hypothetical protein
MKQEVVLRISQSRIANEKRPLLFIASTLAEFGAPLSFTEPLDGSDIKDDVQFHGEVQWVAMDECYSCWSWHREAKEGSVDRVYFFLDENLETEGYE